MPDMATIDAPFGLRPWGDVLHCSMYAIQTTPTTNTFVGDLMVRSAGSLLTPHMGQLLEVIVQGAGAAGATVGACLALFDDHMKPVSHMITTDAGDGTIAGYALIADHPDQEYIMAEDGDTASIAAASVGLNADCISTHAGDTTTGRSKMEIDSDSAAVTISLAVKILGVHPEDTISAAGAAGNHCRFIVKINSSHRGDNVVGI